MQDIKLGMVEARFAEFVWQNEPMAIRDLIAMSEKELQWKRTTTYTVLKKLCDRGILCFENRIVTARISKEEFQAIQSEQFVNDTFRGSLPAFLAAFTARKAPTPEEMDEIKKLLDSLGVM